ncbi:S1/P1 nuclease [Mucilaginibacter sp. McL0603]|uniref:S1/P1 nuclease n=1 Tax=Mucilaginibacter sp. McL0603 TaxID=3415670 RepID=UPI003CF94D2F
MIIWLWESYQISTILYKEVETNNDLDEQYYSDHIGVIHNRIEKAGIRLAGELNRLLDTGQPQ